MIWHAVELHTHTRHSDGQMTVPELLREARAQRLSLIALTDHNTASGLIEAGGSVIPGIEWTTYRGHMTVLGASKYVDWRDIDPENFDEKLRQVHRAGGLACVAHPFRFGSPICTGCHFDYRIRDPWLVDLIEVWSGECPPDAKDSAPSLALWQRSLDAGARTAAVYGRDWHRREAIAPVAVTLMGVEGEITVPKALEALKRGRTAVTMGPAPILTVEQNGARFVPGDELEPVAAVARLVIDPGYRREIWQTYRLALHEVRLIGRGAQVLARQTWRPEGNSFLIQPAEGTLRAEVWGEMGAKPCLIALTSALFVRHKTMITAHNGALGTPPDSVEFLKTAIAAGCEALEVDARVVNGRLILSHDEVAEGTEGLVALSECFRLLADAPRMMVNVDVKQPGIVSKVVSLAEEYGVASRLIFTGDLGPEDMLAFPDHPDAIWNVAPDDSAGAIPDAREAGHTHVNLEFTEVDEALMEQAWSLTLLVSAWTADEEADILRLLKLGVRNITTNRPLLAMKLRAALEQGS